VARGLGERGGGFELSPHRTRRLKIAKITPKVRERKGGSKGIPKGRSRLSLEGMKEKNFPSHSP